VTTETALRLIEVMQGELGEERGTRVAQAVGLLIESVGLENPDPARELLVVASVAAGVLEAVEINAQAPGPDRARAQRIVSRFVAPPRGVS